MSDYQDKLRLTQWRVRRLDILERAQFACEKCRASGCDLHVHHLYYEADRDPWDYPDDALQCLCVACHSFETAKQRGETGDPRAMIGGLAIALAGQLSYRGVKKPLQPAKFNADRAWRWISNLPDTRVHRPLMKFAGWLWNTGIHDMEVLLSLVEDRCRRNPDNAYAYYAPGGESREANAARASIEIGAKENAAHQAEERAFIAEFMPEKPK